MKKLSLMAVNTWLSYLFVSRQLVASIALILGTLESVHAAEFFCSSGNVTCLIASINAANGLPGEHTINLEPGSYTLQAIDNGANGLPVISGSIRIQATADDPPTVIEGDIGALGFRIFQVSIGGELTLDGLTIQRGSRVVGPAILNLGVTTVQDSVVTDNDGELGVILNIGTLNLFRSIIADNFGGHGGGAIHNQLGGFVLVENSTIAHNVSFSPGGIFNEGSLVVRNSAVIFNSTDQAQAGGGIANSGFAEVVNSTIAKNSAGGAAGDGGGGIYNFGGGQVFITNSTIRENEVRNCPPGCQEGAGIENDGGIVQLQNTIVAGNTGGPFNPFLNAPDCFGTITSLGNNLIGDPTGCGINLQPSDLTGDPGLGSLVGEGEDDLPGRAYYPVLAGSPVIERGNPNACLQSDQLGNLRVGICDIGAVEFQGKMLVSIDIRPRSDANRINPKSINNINVAILSANGFDATTVDPNTVRFGATGTEAAPIHVGWRDVDGDGDRDMVVRFQIQDTGIKCGNTAATLTGQISNGPSFIGSSPIQTVHCKTQK
jgi:hypothetical protein